jgi:hypothetical protein
MHDKRFLESYRAEILLQGLLAGKKLHFAQADRQIDREIALDDTVKGRYGERN